jgi:hypothetical protein
MHEPHPLVTQLRFTRTIYHYWFYNGENQAIRQSLGHARLAQFVGDIDNEAPYRPERRRWEDQT